MLTLLLMSTLLTASLVVLAYRTSFTVLLDLAQYAAAICAVLHLVVVSMLMGLIAGASTVWKTPQTAGKHTQELTQLRQVIVNVMHDAHAHACSSSSLYTLCDGYNEGDS
ncbi:hypothetical protein WAE31_12240 (plasmid) [Xanthomonas axonopodis pv. vasculorum]